MTGHRHVGSLCIHHTIEIHRLKDAAGMERRILGEKANLPLGNVMEI